MAIYTFLYFLKTVIKDTANSATSFKYRLIGKQPLLVIGDRKILSCNINFFYIVTSLLSPIYILPKWPLDSSTWHMK